MKLLLFAIPGIVLSCHKDTDHITGEEIIDPPVIQVTTRLVSQTDTAYEVARHATQTFAGSTMAFPSFPFLVTRGNLVDRDFELITITTQDFHQYSHVPSLIENDVNYLHWVLPALQSFHATTSNDAQISINSDFILSIPASSVQLSGGTPYSGSYRVDYALLEPSTFLADAIPSYLAVDDNRLGRTLLMKSCFYISVSSDAGDNLQFGPNAAITFVSTQTGDHWYFDAANAIWKSNPSSLKGTQLDLSSAQYYAIAIPAKPVRAKGSLYINGRSTPHQRMLVSYNGLTRTIYTTNKGAWAIYLPSGEEVNIEVPLPCGDTFSTIITTPDEDDFELPVLINDQGSINSVITGTFRNNQGEALPEGILRLDGSGAGFLYSDDPFFSFNIPICIANTIGIQGLDIATGQSGSTILWQAADSIKVYSVFACEESKMEYLSLAVAGESKMYWDLKSSVNLQSRVIIEEGSMVTDLDLQIAVSGMMDRAYDDEELNIQFEDRQLGQHGYSLYCPTSPSGCGFSTFIITHYPEAQGEWIRGYFEGNFWIKSFYPLTAGYRPVRGEFQVYRDF